MFQWFFWNEKKKDFETELYKLYSHTHIHTHIMWCIMCCRENCIICTLWLFIIDKSMNNFHPTTETKTKAQKKQRNRCVLLMALEI